MCLVYTHYIVFRDRFFLYELLSEFLGLVPYRTSFDRHIQSLLAIVPHHHKKRIGHYITFWK